MRKHEEDENPASHDNRSLTLETIVPENGVV
jgi:hypothetical protein